MPQLSRLDQRRLHFAIPGMPSTESERCRPSIPICAEKWTTSRRNRWSAWLGTRGRHPSESMVGMGRITHLEFLRTLYEHQYLS